MNRLSLGIAFSALFLPLSAEAVTLVQILNLFNIFVGIYLVATFMVFFGSLATYFLRFGTWPSHRDTAVRGLEWGVTMLFVLIVLLAIVQFFEYHTEIAVAILSVIAILIIAYLILTSIGNGEKEEEKEEE